MKFISYLTGIVFALTVSVVSAQETPPDYEPDPGLVGACKAMDAAIVAISASPMVQGIRAAGVVLLGMEFYDTFSEGKYSRSQECAMDMQDWARHYQENPIDYTDFVEETCGGNPFNCPGGFNVGQPIDCSTFIVCSNYPGDMWTSGFSFNDLVAPFSIVEQNFYYNDWDYQPYAAELP